MGDVIKFTGKRLSGLVPEQNDDDPKQSEAPKPEKSPKMAEPENDYLAPPDDCA